MAKLGVETTPGLRNTPEKLMNQSPHRMFSRMHRASQTPDLLSEVNCNPCLVAGAGFFLRQAEQSCEARPQGEKIHMRILPTRPLTCWSCDFLLRGSYADILPNYNASIQALSAITFWLLGLMRYLEHFGISLVIISICWVLNSPPQLFYL